MASHGTWGSPPTRHYPLPQAPFWRAFHTAREAFAIIVPGLGRASGASSGRGRFATLLGLFDVVYKRKPAKSKTLNEFRFLQKSNNRCCSNPSGIPNPSGGQVHKVWNIATAPPFHHICYCEDSPCQNAIDIALASGHAYWNGEGAIPRIPGQLSNSLQ